MKNRTSLQNKTSTHKKKSIFLILIILILFVLLISISYQLSLIYQKRYAIEQEKNQFSQEIAKIQFQNTQLAQLQAYISSELYIDRELKKKLDYQNPGETAVIVSIPEEEIPQDSVQFPSDQPTENTSLLPSAETPIQKWWAFFFSKNRL